MRLPVIWKFPSCDFFNESFGFSPFTPVTQNMKNYGIKLISHNIPKVVPRNFSGVFGFRVQNVSEKALHFHSHYAFYGNPIHGRKFQLQLF